MLLIFQYQFQITLDSNIKYLKFIIQLLFQLREDK